MSSLHRSILDHHNEGSRLTSKDNLCETSLISLKLSLL